jgi:hypothetical protein
LNKNTDIFPVVSILKKFSRAMKFYGNRDLMVVLRPTHSDAKVLYAETEWLNSMLNHVESTPNLARCCEVIHLSRFRIETKYDRVLKALQQKELKPFVFVFNKN